MPIKEFIGLRSKMYSYFSKILKLSEDTIEDKKKCETLKECTNKIAKLRGGSVLDASIFEEIDRCKKSKQETKDQVKKCFIHENKNVREYLKTP